MRALAFYLPMSVRYKNISSYAVKYKPSLQVLVVQPLGLQR